MKFSQSAALALTCISLSSGVSGAPMIRDEPNEKNLGDLMGSALSKWLAGQGIKGFRGIPGGKQVDWLTSGDGSTTTSASSDATPTEDTSSDPNVRRANTSGKMTQEAGNAIIFKTADRITAFDDKDKESFFSDAYKVFVQDLGLKLGLNATSESDDLKKKEEDADKKCGTILSNISATVKKELIENAKKMDPNVSPSHKEVNTAVMKSARWKGANADCESARQAFSAAYDKEHGFNFALFAQANKNMRPIADSVTTVVEGVTMAADTESTTGAGESAFDSPTGQGNVLPLYTIPILESTMKAWQARDDAADPEYIWESKNEKTKTQKELSSGSFTGSVDFSRISGSNTIEQSTEHEEETTTAQEFTVKFGGITLMDIETGLWFDGYRMAAQAEKPIDSKSAAAKDVFHKHFGYKNKPLPAAHYNKQAVVAYKPSWTMKFSSEKSLRNFQELSIERSSSFLMIESSQSGKKMKDVTTTDKSTNTATYNPTTKHGIILGYVVENYKFGDDEKAPLFPDTTTITTASPTAAKTSSSSAASSKSSGSSSSSASSSAAAKSSSSDADASPTDTSADSEATPTDDASATDSATDSEETPAEDAEATDSPADSETTDDAADAEATDEPSSTKASAKKTGSASAKKTKATATDSE